MSAASTTWTPVTTLPAEPRTAAPTELLHDRLIRDGHWLFRHRSVLPFVLLAPLAWSCWSFQWLGGSAELQHAWNWGCVVVSLLGLLVRVTTIGFVPQGTSGRNTRQQVAATLNTSGWYSITRNPLYLGNFLIGLGFPLTLHDPLLVLLYGTAFWLYYERIISAEEAFLATKFGSGYRDWARRTPAFLPDWRQWSAPRLEFCWRTVLRREHSALLLIGGVYSTIAAVQSALTAGTLLPTADWWGLLGSTALSYILLRHFKKRTRLFRVAGR